MRSTLRALVVAAVTVAGAAYLNVATAAEAIAGTVTKLTMNADGKSALAVVKDAKSGAAVSITISDSETLEQIKGKRSAEGDSVRGKFEAAGGKNEKGSLRKKTAGC